MLKLHVLKLKLHVLKLNSMVYGWNLYNLLIRLGQVKTDVELILKKKFQILWVCNFFFNVEKYLFFRGPDEQIVKISTINHWVQLQNMEFHHQNMEFQHQNMDFQLWTGFTEGEPSGSTIRALKISQNVQFSSLQVGKKTAKSRTDLYN